MSCTEFHKGKLIKIKEYSSEEELAKDKGISADDIFDWCYDNDMYFIKNTLYKIENHYKTDDEDETFCYLFPKEDGSIEFISQFYNGGTWLGEMLEDAINEYKLST